MNEHYRQFTMNENERQMLAGISGDIMDESPNVIKMMRKTQHKMRDIKRKKEARKRDNRYTQCLMTMANN